MCAQSSPAWISLAPRPTGVSVGRCFARSKLTRYKDDDFAYSVELVVSELVTNAYRAVEASKCRVQGVIRLGVHCTNRWVHVCVQDSAPKMPDPREASETDESGRGLQIVEALAVLWVHGRDLDKTVHALVTAPGVVLTQHDMDQLAVSL
jgi:anti-sigma regulatory factor (Ser/Thr protein kinase)